MKARPRGTDGSLLASLPWTLLALLVALAPHVPYLPLWITAAFAICAAWRYAIEQRRRPLPRPWVRGALALACFLGVLGTYSSISGVGPGSALLAIMAALKLLETRKRRDQFVLLFISIFLVMSSLLREQYLWSIGYLVVSMVVIMTAWLRMSASSSVPARDSLRTGGRLLLYAAPLALAMWIFFPRLSSPFWAVPIDTSQATTGISDSMSPGDISNLSQSNAVAFRVQFDGEIPAPRDRYWRGLVLTGFNGRTWTRWENLDARRTALREIRTRGEPVRYTVTMEPTRQHFVFALEMVAELPDLRQVRMGPEQQLWRVTPIEQRIAYAVESYTDFTITSELRGPRRWYTNIPATGNQRTVELARQMRAAANSDEAFIDDVLRMFNEQEFYYTLQPPALGNNPVDRFLFDTQRGFCEHYSSAFTFMMRAAGIPARVVLGYQGGEVNPLGGHMIVRQSDAHAWSEVWIDGRGWLRADPTAAVAPERIEFESSDPAYEGLAASWGFSSSSRFFHNLQMTWDALDARWNEFILGYGPDQQRDLMSLLGMVNPSWTKMSLTMIILVIALVLAISGVLYLRYRPPPPDPAVRLYRRFVKHSGLEQRIGETPGEFALRAIRHGELAADRVSEVTGAYLECRYEPGGKEQIARLETAVRSLRAA